MAASEVHRELLVAREPFCGLLGMSVWQRNLFVVENVLALLIDSLLVYVVLTCIYLLQSVCTHSTC